MIEPITIPNPRIFSSSSLFIGTDYLIEGDVHLKLELGYFEIKLPEKSLFKLLDVFFNLPHSLKPREVNIFIQEPELTTANSFQFSKAANFKAKRPNLGQLTD